ncbi:MAG: hypothetical protein AB1600_11150 [Bacteroidota bacterium]
MKVTILCTLTVFVFIISSGCATLLKGYEDNVKIMNASDSLRIFTKEGIEIPIMRDTVHTNYDIHYSVRSIKLRSNQNHTLILKKQNEEKIVELYPRLGLGWVVLDLLCGGFPSFYDAYTGNWNTFPPIDGSMNKK